MSQGNESYVVKSINLSYYHPAILEDELTVKTEIELVSKARTIFFQSVLNTKNDTLICRGEVESVLLKITQANQKLFL